MEAFRFKEGYPTGAGECVSLAALYAASSAVVAEIPLDDIYMWQHRFIHRIFWTSEMAYLQ
jgi:hypothetical protein